MTDTKSSHNGAIVTA